MKTILVPLFCFFLGSTILLGQSISYSGTFMNPEGSIILQIKPMSGNYHGVITANGAYLAFDGTNNKGVLQGNIYTVNGPVQFSASINNNLLYLNAFGYSNAFYQTNPNHGLQQIDLTPYLTTNYQQQRNVYQPQQNNTDYDHSYSQASPGNATERYQTYPGSNPTVSSPYPALNNANLRQLIAGSQVVFYTRTSILNSNTASSITYVNYCPNGTFNMTYDGSFSVEGYTGANAQGASNGRHSGRWQLVNYQGSPAVYLAYNNGQTAVYPFNTQQVMQGRWRVGNTQYAIQRGGAVCR